MVSGIGKLLQHPLGTQDLKFGKAEDLEAFLAAARYQVKGIEALGQLGSRVVIDSEDTAVRGHIVLGKHQT